MIQIPVFQDKSSKFKQEIILGGRLLEIILRWNIRCNCWYMDVADVETGDAISGLKLVEDWLLIRQYRATVPNFSGDFIVKNIEGVQTELTYDNLGNGFYLYYVTDDEGDAWEEANGVG